jgi:hypothetical protein
MFASKEGTYLISNAFIWLHFVEVSILTFKYWTRPKILDRKKRRHETQNNDIQCDDTQHNGRALLPSVWFVLSISYCVTYKPFILDVILLNVVTLSALCLMSLR